MYSGKLEDVFIKIYKYGFIKTIIKWKQNTHGVKGLVTNSGPVLPLTLLGLLLMSAGLSPCSTFPLEDLKE